MARARYIACVAHHACTVHAWDTMYVGVSTFSPFDPVVKVTEMEHWLPLNPTLNGRFLTEPLYRFGGRNYQQLDSVVSTHIPDVFEPPRVRPKRVPFPTFALEVAHDVKDGIIMRVSSMIDGSTNGDLSNNLSYAQSLSLLKKMIH